LTDAQLNWKPNNESWSIGQCIDHIVIADCLYFPQLEKIAEDKYKINFWEQWSPFSGLFGKMLVSQVGEIPKKKMIAPKVFTPSQSRVDRGIIERFYKHLDSLLEYISRCSQKDLDKIRVTSPVSKFITYSLRNAFLLLVQHEHRHINQAIRTRNMDDFPKA
jgi:hypothetical protein